MSLTTEVWTTYPTKGQRESLADAIYNISPEQTPLSSGIDRGAAKATLEEWQTDSLAAAITTNAFIEGDTFTFATPAATSRVGNYVQTLTKTAQVGAINDIIDKAGRKSEMAYQVMKRGKEIRRDLEATLLTSQGGSAGSVGATARKFAALNAWVKTNVSYYTTDGGNPTYTSGVPAAARTDGGTLRAFTETIGKAVMNLCFTAGAEPSVLFTGPFNKQVASTFGGVADRVFNLNTPKAATIIGAADVWVTDFGTLRVVPNRFQRERDAWFIDYDQLEILTLRPMHTVDIAKVSDATRKAIIWDVTLKVKQEAGLGLAADLTTA